MHQIRSLRGVGQHAGPPSPKGSDLASFKGNSNASPVVASPCIWTPAHEVQVIRMQDHGPAWGRPLCIIIKLQIHQIVWMSKYCAISDMSPSETVRGGQANSGPSNAHPSGRSTRGYPLHCAHTARYFQTEFSPEEPQVKSRKRAPSKCPQNKATPASLAEHSCVLPSLPRTRLKIMDLLRPSGSQIRTSTNVMREHSIKIPVIKQQ
mmetsp:Transcript_63990/g.106924  ORF Transcript_63990/g.106924 Transcript_63990/m.106924 type:complete len:207 (+) Transcript_63990:1155-1775(+)